MRQAPRRNSHLRDRMRGRQEVPRGSALRQRRRPDGLQAHHRRRGLVAGTAHRARCPTFMPSASFPFRSSKSRTRALEWYDRTLAALAHDARDVETRFGTTRVVIAGSGAPLVMLHGGGASVATMADELE